MRRTYILCSEDEIDSTLVTHATCGHTKIMLRSSCAVVVSQGRRKLCCTVVHRHEVGQVAAQCVPLLSSFGQLLLQLSELLFRRSGTRQYGADCSWILP